MACLTPHSTPAWDMNFAMLQPPCSFLSLCLRTHRQTSMFICPFWMLFCLWHSEVCSSATSLLSRAPSLSLKSQCFLLHSLLLSSPPPSLSFFSLCSVHGCTLHRFVRTTRLPWVRLYSFHHDTLHTFLQPPWCVVVLSGSVVLKDVAHLRDISPSSIHVQIPCGTHPTHLTHPIPHSYRSCRSHLPSFFPSSLPSFLPSFTCIALACPLAPYFLFFSFFFSLSLVIVSTPDRCFVVLHKREDSLFVPHQLCFSHPLLITQQPVPLPLWRAHICARWAGLVTAFGNHFSFLSLPFLFGQSAVPVSLSCLLS